MRKVKRKRLLASQNVLFCPVTHTQEVTCLKYRQKRRLHWAFNIYTTDRTAAHHHTSRYFSDTTQTCVAVTRLADLLSFSLRAVFASADQQHHLPSGGQQAVLQPAQVQLPPSQHLKSAAQFSERLRKMEQHLVYTCTYFY